MLEGLSSAAAAQPQVVTYGYANPESAIPEAPAVRQGVSSEFYISPVIRFDPQALAVIFAVRDSESGEVKLQFPPERVVRELQRNSIKPELPQIGPRETDAAPIQGNGAEKSAESTAPIAGAAATGGEAAETEIDVLI